MASALECETYSVHEVAKVLGWSERSIYRAVEEERFPVKALRLGKTIRFTRRSIDLLLASCDKSVSFQ